MSAPASAPINQGHSQQVPPEKVNRPKSLIIALCLLGLSILAVASVWMPWFTFGSETLSGRSVVRETDTPPGSVLLILGGLGIVGSLLYLIPARPVKLICAIGGVLGGLAIAAYGAYEMSNPGNLSDAEIALAKQAFGSGPDVQYGLWVAVLSGIGIVAMSLFAMVKGLRK